MKVLPSPTPTASYYTTSLPERLVKYAASSLVKDTFWETGETRNILAAQAVLEIGMAVLSESRDVGFTLQQSRKNALGERFISALLMAAAALSIVTTFAIVLSLAGDTIAFFQEVSLIEYLTGTLWTPLFSNPKFGIWPLITATFMTSAIAMLVAVPLGLAIAVYLSEFASLRMRSLIKPLLEVLAGHPTVYMVTLRLRRSRPSCEGSSRRLNHSTR